MAYLWHADGRTLWPVNTLQLQFLISIVAGWVNRGQQDLIEYLQEENRVLREQLGTKRLRFTDVQRRRLAAKARKIGRKGLFEIDTLVTPDTLLRWYRRLIAKKYDGSQARGAGRPKTAAEIERLILRMARDNPRWGYTRIRGALRNLGHEIGRNTIKRILLENGFDPVVCQNSADPLRGPPVVVVQDPTQPFSSSDIATHVGRATSILDQLVVELSVLKTGPARAT